MGLLTDPPRLVRGGKPLERGIGRQVRHIVLLLPGRLSLTDEPDLIARHVLHAIISIRCLCPSGNADTASRKETCQPTSAVAPPADLSQASLQQNPAAATRRRRKRSSSARNSGGRVLPSPVRRSPMSRSHDRSDGLPLMPCVNNNASIRFSQRSFSCTRCSR